MKKVFLICNAHIDPVWQWEWEEGVATAISTFRCAADFCEEFPNYIFCHNESLLLEIRQGYQFLSQPYCSFCFTCKNTHH